MNSLPLNNKVSISIKNLRSVWPPGLVSKGSISAELVDLETNNSIAGPIVIPYTGIPGRFEGAFSAPMTRDREYKLTITYIDDTGSLTATWVSYLRCEERPATVGA